MAPPSLHGASGLPAGDIRRAVAWGIAKVNVNTELRQRYLAITQERVGPLVAGARVIDLNAAQVEAVRSTVDEKLAVLEGAR